MKPIHIFSRKVNVALKPENLFILTKNSGEQVLAVRINDNEYSIVAKIKNQKLVIFRFPKEKHGGSHWPPRGIVRIDSAPSEIFIEYTKSVKK